MEGRKVKVGKGIFSLLAVSGIFVSIASTQSDSGSAQYPLRPVTIVVPFAAGGAFDVLARSIGNGMSILMKQPVVIENVSGAGGTIGAAKIAKATPDGYSVLMGSLGPNAAASALNKDLQYDPRKDFEPIILVATTPMVLEVKKDLPVQNLDEFIRYAQSHKLSAGTAGIGSISDVALLLFSHATNTSFVDVPYRSLPLSMTDLIAGRIDLMFDQIVTAKQHIQSGEVRALALTSPRRSPMFPQIPTTTELGFPNVEVVAWAALFAPKGTPRPIVAKLNEAANHALQNPTVMKAFSALGADIASPDDRTPQALERFVNSEIDKWTPLLGGL